MQEAIDKAAALVEAHQYIRSFADKSIVVKVGGSIMDEPEALSRLINDICFMAAVGMRPIIVHGGGKSITEAMNNAGLEAHFVQGRRYTDERTLAIAEHVLVNQINKSIVDQVRENGHKTMGLHSLASCAVFGDRMFLQLPDEEDANKTRKVDIGFVGEVKWVNGELLQALAESGTIPVIAPIARDRSGSKLNINADSVAGHVAAAVKAEKLMLVSDTHGIRTTDDAESLASHLDRNEVDELIEKGIIAAGMLPKVEAAMVGLEGGVNKVHIIDGRIPHSLLLEIYTTQGIGTEIVL